MTCRASTTAGGVEVQLELSIAAEIARVVTGRVILYFKKSLLMIEGAFMPSD